jgi:16S rRNA (guanine1207-N2)-methyltransferase
LARHEDAALALLLSALAASEPPRLWLTGEQGQLPAGDLPFDQALTNRVDVAQALQARGLPTLLIDFDLSQLEKPPQSIGFRIAKEKALTHHVINQAAQVLPPGGWLWLCGDKREGIKGYLQRTARLFASQPRLQRQAGMQLGGFQRPQRLDQSALLDDQRYAELQQLPFDGERYWTKPGIFGWRSIDQGSALLAAQLEETWPAAQAPRRILDLGCGYGYLAVQAARRWPDAEVVASDNNVAAIRACTENLAPFGTRATTCLADSGAGLSGPFNAILCNPPFHQSFALQPDLHERFLQRCRELLAADGQALFVVNQFLPLERIAEACFATIDTVARTRSFKVIRLARPRRR